MKLVSVENVTVEHEGNQVTGIAVAMDITSEVIVFQGGGADVGVHFRLTADNMGELEYGVLTSKIEEQIKKESSNSNFPFYIDDDTVQPETTILLGDGAREVAKDLLDASEHYHSIGDQIREVPMEYILGEAYSSLEEHRDDIGKVFSDISVVLTQAGKIAKHVGGFIEVMDESGKTDFIETFNSPELEEYKDTVAKANDLFGDIIKQFSKYADHYGHQLDVSQSYWKQFAPKWDAARFFGMSRSYKVKSAINKITDIFE